MSDPNRTLEEMVRQECAAWPTSTPEVMAEMYVEDCLIIDPNNPVPVRGKKALCQWFEDALKAFGTFSSTKMLHFELIADNAAYYEFIATYTPEGAEEQHILFRAVLICEKVEGTWKGKFEQWDGFPCDAQGNRLASGT